MAKENCFHCEVHRLIAERIEQCSLTSKMAAFYLLKVVGELIRDGVPDPDNRTVVLAEAFRHLAEGAGSENVRTEIVSDEGDNNHTRH